MAVAGATTPALHLPTAARKVTVDDNEDYLDDDAVASALVEYRTVQPITASDLAEVALRFAADLADSYANAFRRLAVYTAADRDWRQERREMHEDAALEIESLIGDSE